MKANIYDSNWLNIVFEGKNKQYGAYQLRQESSRTTFFAFVLGLLFISMFAIGMLLGPTRSVAATLPDEIISVPLMLDNIKPNKPPGKAAVVPPAREKKPTDIPEPKELKDPTIVHAIEAEDFKKNNDPAPTPDPGPTSGTATPGTGTPGTPATGTGTIVTPEIPNNDPVIPVALDKMPEFPGGMAPFYKYIADNFEKPEIDETVNVLMAFVIERDGSMSNIRVLRNPGYGLDKEAIRVLKSLRTKWKPGIKDGRTVRTQYTLPIKVTRN